MNVAIIGVGSRGTAVAQAVALAGHNIALYDISTPNLQRAQNQIKYALQKKKPDPSALIPRPRPVIATTTILEECAAATLIIDCTPDKLEIKKSLFERLDRAAEPKTIIATTAATLSISVLAACVKKHPERIVGLHFVNSVEASIVEIVRGDRTEKKALDQIAEFIADLDKQAVIVADRPGYLFHRVADLYTGEALRVLGDNRVNADQLDKLMASLGIGEGPLHYLDAVGLDDSLAIKQALYSATYHDPRYRPHPIQHQLVQAGHLGRKTRRGFHDYQGSTS